MHTAQVAARIYRAGTVVWGLGTTAVVLSWFGIVPAQIGWIGFGTGIVGVILTLLARRPQWFVAAPDVGQLDDPLAQALPDVLALAGVHTLVQQGVMTNPQLAQTHRDPDATLARLQQRGRQIGVFREYHTATGTTGQSRDTFVSGVQYAHDTGASAAVHERDPELFAANSAHEQRALPSTIGDEATLWRETTPDAQHNDALYVRYMLTFRRANIVGRVIIGARARNAAEAVLVEQATALASMMDTRIAAMRSETGR